MILADEFIKLSMSDAFKEMFLVVIQLGAILAVVILYFNKLNPFSFKKPQKKKRDYINLVQGHSWDNPLQECWVYYSMIGLRKLL